MKNKLKILLFLLLATTSMMHAQKVKLKKGKAIIEDVHVFDCEKGPAEWVTLLDKETGEELIFIRIEFGAKQGKQDYTIYKFLKEDIVVEVSGYNLLKNHVKFLYTNKVFDLNGELNLSKIQALKAKFDENITNRTDF